MPNHPADLTDLSEAARKLELDRVRQQILRFIQSDPGRTALHSLPFITTLPEIQAELTRVTEAKRLIEEEGDFVIDGLFDVDAPLRKSGVPGSILTAREFLQIASSLKAARSVRSFLSRHREIIPHLRELAESLHTNKVLEFNIDHALDAAGTVRSTASKELKTIRQSISDKHSRLREELAGILKKISDRGFSQEDIITTREGRMVIPVKTEHRGRVPGFVHSASSSGATVFVEPAPTLDLNNEIADMQFREKREIDRILLELTRQVGESSSEMLRNLGILACLDTLQARAKYSIEILGIEPRLTQTEPMRFRGARHPLLIPSHGFGGTVPVDADLGDGFNTLIISGPNAGGKSVTMKCIGLQCLMAQSGIHVPASDGTVFRVFERIYVDIGDEQSIENDLSTFSSHLSNLNRIVRSADSKTLVLLDEIGNGTDPAEGGAFAAAVLEALTARGSLTVATTHHGFLKVFAHETPGIENGAMEFDLATLHPTYRFRCGIPGSSYALEMARRLEMDEGVVARSREFLGENQTRLETLISELEKSTQRYRHDLENLVEQQKRLDSLIREYEGKKTRLTTEMREERKTILEEAREALNRANRLVESTVREIRESGAEGNIVRNARRPLNEMKEYLQNEITKVPSSAEFNGGTVTEGATVMLRGSTERGRVDQILQTNRAAYVLFGNLRIRVNLEDLAVVEGMPTDTVRPAFAGPEFPANHLRDLDVRGMTGVEAIPLVDKFLDGAVLSGLHRIDIIHGKGTGVLGKKIHDFLGSDQRIQSFRFGDWNEGGTGATIVELRDDQ